MTCERCKTLEAALQEIRRLTKSASDVHLIRLSSVAAQALYPDWRNGGMPALAAQDDPEPPFDPPDSAWPADREAKNE